MSCYLKKRCSWCNGKHHSALCISTGIDGHKSFRTDPAEENTSNTNMRNPEKDNSTIPEGSTLVGLTHTSQDTILLQSPLVDIAAGSRSCQAQLLFDSGSQRTFISQDLTNKIGAQPLSSRLELKLQDMHLLQLGLFMYSHQYRTLPLKFDCKFTLQKEIHSYHTRNSHLYRWPLCRTNIKQFSVFYQGPKFYNSLSTEIVNSPSSVSCKKALKAFFCNNY